MLLLEENGGTVEQFDVDVMKLPLVGQHEGAVFEVIVEDGGSVKQNLFLVLHSLVRNLCRSDSIGSRSGCQIETDWWQTELEPFLLSLEKLEYHVDVVG